MVPTLKIPSVQWQPRLAIKPFHVSFGEHLRSIRNEEEGEKWQGMMARWAVEFTRRSFYSGTGNLRRALCQVWRNHVLRGKLCRYVRSRRFGVKSESTTRWKVMAGKKSQILNLRWHRPHCPGGWVEQTRRKADLNSWDLGSLELGVALSKKEKVRKLETSLLSVFPTLYLHPP